ncbi:hypothetical protein EON65_35270 [archaeon]|nr:MAG: hypothetical protein EON65_35270 [archaeon]
MYSAHNINRTTAYTYITLTTNPNTYTTFTHTHKPQDLPASTLAQSEAKSSEGSWTGSVTAHNKRRASC